MTASLVHPHQPRRTPAPRHGEPLQAVPAPLRLVPEPEGLLQIHTAPFRGSFGVVFSQALRSAGLGSRVLVSQFLKGGVDQGPGGSLRLCGRLEWLRPAMALCLELPAQTLAGSEEGTEALAAVQQVWGISRDQLRAGSVDLMVLDELGLAIELGYLEIDEVAATLGERPSHVDVILTGPAIPAALMAMADQVTELRRGL
ncbi:MAG: cob(I)yrinic acid a,c-diamide adenosyltransferase [Synechococcaceae cyanobacterium]|nr:cob(I)yrinic acid a,c-diamide adenosyltransferase [Synechococcaceae cyanobacterium]